MIASLIEAKHHTKIAIRKLERYGGSDTYRAREFLDAALRRIEYQIDKEVERASD